MEQMEQRDWKTDVLKDWMNRDMAAPPSPSSSTTLRSSSATTTTASDNMSQQSSPCLPSLESFLFLPQLPVNGDDGVDEDADFFRHHYPRQCDMQRRTQQHLLPPTNFPTKSSSIRWCSNPFSSSDYENVDHKNSNCQQSQSVRATDSGVAFRPITMIPDDEASFSSYAHVVCGDDAANFPCKSSFSFIPANGTVIVSTSSTKLNNTDERDADVVEINKLQEKDRLSSTSSMSIFVKSNPPNRSHNYNHSPLNFAANHQHPPHLHRYPHQNHRHHCSRRRVLIFRICQVFSVLICSAFLLNLVKTSIWAENAMNRPDSIVPSTPLSSLASSGLQQRLIQSWNMPSMLSSSSSSFSSSSTTSTFKAPDIVSNLTSSNGDLVLLDLPNFRFLMNNKTKCNIPRDDDNYTDGTANNENGTIFFIIIVHSAPRNYQERQAIRETWGSLERLGQFQIRLVFLLGQDLTADDYPGDRKKDNKKNNDIAGNDDGEKLYGKNHNKLEGEIKKESEQYGDIVSGSFHDDYRNLTYKHLMGYLWVLNHCSHAKFVLKADDDTAIDIFQLFKFVTRTFGEEPEAALICNVFPQGTKPVRGTDKKGKKWAVTYKEWKYDSYPKYCGGLAYLVTPNIIREIYRVSGKFRNTFLWIDDVYVTGILREMAHVEPFYLNLRYSYDPEEYRKWLLAEERNEENNKDGEISDESGFTYVNTGDRRGVTAAASPTAALPNQMKNERRGLTPPQKIPFMFVHLERGPEMGREMREIWNKTLNVWSESGLIV